ncbi:MAG: hypothetical protein K2K74_08675 [Lachnospiraceae bacterium]|nr:hypothetical protein [Lachnospiraceae bacterium]
MSQKKVIMRAGMTAVGLTYVLNLSIVSIYPLGLFGICMYLYTHENTDEKLSIYVKGVALLLSIFLSGGKIDFILEGGRLEGCAGMVFILLGSYNFLIWAVKGIFHLYDNVNSKTYHTVKKIYPNKIFAISFISIALVNTLFWLVEYLGVLTYDSIVQLEQILGEWPLNDWHPIAHTLWIKLWYQIAYVCGMDNNTEAYGFISMIQLIIMDIVFSFVIRFLYVRSRRLCVAVGGIAFYGLVFYNSIYSVTLWKDVAHGFVAVLLILFLLLYFEKHEGKRRMYYLIAIFICGCSFCLFRNNGYYAFILWAVFMVLYSVIRRDKGMIITIALIAVTCAIVKGPVYSSVSGSESYWTTSASIPLQQVAYCIAKGNELKDDEIELLSRIVDVEQIPEVYLDYISDPVVKLIIQKGNKEYFKKHKKQYLGVYLKIGMRYPLDYLVSWIRQTYGYWYPDISYWVYSIGVYENNYGIHPAPKLRQSVVNAVHESVQRYSSIPIYGSFWCLGTFAWCLLVMTAYVAHKKRWELAAAFGLLICIWGTLLVSTPVYAEFRYLYSVTAAFPLIIFMPLCIGKE